MTTSTYSLSRQSASSPLESEKIKIHSHRFRPHYELATVHLSYRIMRELGVILTQSSLLDRVIPTCRYSRMMFVSDAFGALNIM